jgi:hypothetical protein
MKAQQFARKCNQRALNGVCNLCRASGNTPLRVDHIRRALRAGNGVTMLAWLAQAAREGWTSDQLDNQIKREKGGRPSRAGPRIRGPKNLLEALDQVERYSNEWLKRYDQLWGQEACWLMLPREPGDSRAAERLKAVREELGRLREAAGDLGERLAKLERETRRKSKTDRVPDEPARMETSGTRRRVSSK